MLIHFILAACLVRSGPVIGDSGQIRGTVVNGSRTDEPVAGAEVILQAQQDGAFVPVAQVAADERGEFVFADLPLDDATVFLPGASRDGVHYPGERLRLDGRHRDVITSIRVFDTVTEPSPLVARRHEIAIHTEPNLLSVTETIWVSNPSTTTYVGGAAGKRPVTLRLRVPPDFEKITFQKEFYGRRFALIDGDLVTTIPWPPGERELSFTYVLPVEAKHQVWERPLDVPCGELRVSVFAPNEEGVTCNRASLPAGPGGELIYEHHGPVLPAGHAVRVEFGRLAAPFETNARWIALGVLFAMIVIAASAALASRRRSTHSEMIARTCEVHTPRHRKTREPAAPVRGRGRAMRA